MLKTVLAAILASVCSAGAQTAPISDSQFNSELGKVFVQNVSSGRALGRAMAERTRAPASVLDQVMTAMADAPGSGEEIVQWLRDHKAVVEFSDFVKGESAHAWLGDFVPDPRKPAVYISALLLQPPVSYRLLGSLIAKEGAELMLKDFPESAEKRAIVAGRMAEAYFELGGTRLALPDFDGTVDEDAAATIRIWIENAPEQSVQLFHARGHKTLEEIRAELGDAPAQSERTLRQLEAVSKAEGEFQRFQRSEADWIRAHRPS